MATAVFNSSFVYTPGGGGTLAQSFTIETKYVAISSGTIDVPASVAAGQVIEIPFGGVGVGALGVVIRNKIDKDLGVRPGPPAAGAPADPFSIPPDGVLVYWAPKKGPAGTPLKACGLTVLAAPTVDGSIDYIVLGE